MPIDFQRQRAVFPSKSGGGQSVELSFVFPGPVIQAESAINGYSIGFSESDRHIYRVKVDTAVTSISSNVVKVRVDYLLRDSSGNIDDPFEGYVDVLVIVDRNV